MSCKTRVALHYKNHICRQFSVHLFEKILLESAHDAFAYDRHKISISSQTREERGRANILEHYGMTIHDFFKIYSFHSHVHVFFSSDASPNGENSLSEGK
jgi:hypothetical protein